MDSAKLSDAEKLCFTSLIEVSDRIHKRSLTSADVTRAVLDRIAALNPKLHAYLRVFEDSAMKSAAAADNEIGAGKWRGPLHGVPVAVKDLCQTKGEITTCASKLLRDWRPDSNAAVVDSFERAGAVLLGKLNLTEFAVAWYHPEMPVPLNPWDAALWPGASSSGSGIATAAGLSFATIGTDTGGSIRFPAAACGVVGLKPTWGRVSRAGVFPLGESLDHIGPIVRSVADAAAVLAAIAGQDPADETSLAAPVEDYVAAVARGAARMRIGIDERYIAAGAEPKLGAAVIEAVRVLERAGARVVNVAIPEVEACLEAWTTLCEAEAAMTHGATYPSRASEYGPGFRSFLEVGNEIRGVDYARANLVRERFANRFQSIFDKIDALACPSMPMLSLAASGMAPDARGFAGPNPLLRYTGPFNMSRNPTLSLPCGDGGGAPPPSLQLVGRILGESAILQAGGAFERATSWHEQRPSL